MQSMIRTEKEIIIKTIIEQGTINVNDKVLLSGLSGDYKLIVGRILVNGKIQIMLQKMKMLLSLYVMKIIAIYN